MECKICKKEILKKERVEFLTDLYKHFNFQFKIKDLIRKWEKKLG